MRYILIPSCMARVSQIMGLLKLAPQIQKELLALQDQVAIRFFSERRLRPLLTIKSPRKQVMEFREMKERGSTNPL